MAFLVGWWEILPKKLKVSSLLSYVTESVFAIAFKNWSENSVMVNLESMQHPV
jgi:hypothetical protein